jgi:hypothetical protein
MSFGQEVPSGYYVSNSSDEDCFYVDKDGNFYFKKETGWSWVHTDKWNFDHICNVETVNSKQGFDVSVDNHDDRGLEVKVSAHIGVTVSDVMKWSYVNPDGNQAKVWVGADGGPGKGVSMDAGVWYDKHGDLHLKLSTCNVIPHVDFGGVLVINPKTIDDLDKPTDVDRAVATGIAEGATLGIVTKPPKILTQSVAVVHKIGNTVGGWLKKL